MGQTSINFYSWMGRYKTLIALSLILHLVAALFSTGFLHPDEHFQNFEFMMGRWGGLGTHYLPWEFGAQMRPWLLPALISLTRAALNVDIFTLETIWRTLSSLIAFTSLLYFIKSASLRLHHEKFSLWLTCSFFWFLPFIHARVSGESLGASLFILGLVPFLKKRTADDYLHLIASGLLIGLSIQLRYHIGFMLVGLLCFEYKRWREVSICLLGVTLATVVGVLIDSYGYMSFTLAPWNYITENIVKDKASQFGVSPWYWYLTRVHTTLYPPISLFIVASFLWQWTTRTRSLLTALTLPFFVIHCLVGHKEMRFLIPMIPFAILIGGQFYVWVLRNFKLIAPRTWRSLMNTLFAMSLILALISAIKPASNDYAFLDKWRSHTAPSAYYIGAESPFNMYQLEARSLLYNPPQLVRIPNTENFTEFASSLESGAVINVIASSPADQAWLTQIYSGCRQILIASKIAQFFKSKRNPALYTCEVTQ